MAYRAKTRPTAAGVRAFIDSAEPDVRRQDGHRLCDLMQAISGLEPVMWGPSIVGFGAYHYRYASGHEGDAPLVGFSPRKANLVFYLFGCDEGRDDLLARLGKHKAGKGCVYVNRLADVDPAVLKAMAATAADQLRTRYPGERP